MRIGFDENLAGTLDIPSAPKRCVGVTTQQPDEGSSLNLTDGQRDCLRLVYQHMTSKDIARVLGVSPHTVDMRLRTAMRTLSVASRIEAARMLVQDESGGAGGPDIYQPLIYQASDIAPAADRSSLASPASVEGDVSASTNHTLRLSPDVDPFASGPPRETIASAALEEAHPVSWAGAGIADAGIGTRPLAGSLPWGERNNLGVGARLTWICLIAIGSSLAFGSILGALAALKALL